MFLLPMFCVSLCCIPWVLCHHGYGFFAGNRCINTFFCSYRFSLFERCGGGPPSAVPCCSAFPHSGSGLPSAPAAMVKAKEASESSPFALVLIDNERPPSAPAA